MEAAGESLDAKRRRAMHEAAVRAESDWWFDAARLHTPDDLQRMARAQERLLAETSRHPPPRGMRMPADAHAPLPEPASLNDVGRELEVSCRDTQTHTTVPGFFPWHPDAQCPH